MSIRSTRLNNYGTNAITHEIDSRYDVVKAVSLYLDQIQYITDTGIAELIAVLTEAKDFSGITVVAGETANWDSETKVLTVPTVQGEQGIEGETGLQGVQGERGERGFQGLKGDKGDTGSNGMNGANGLTPTIQLFYDDITGELSYEVTYV